MTTAETQRRSAPAVAPEGAPLREPAPIVPRISRTAQGWMTGLSLLISLLALVATIAGIFTANGVHHRVFTSLRGETVALQGGGLYANESVSGAAQAIGLDVITLFVGIPLLLLATYLAAKGSLRGRLLRAGALWYFAYAYLLMAFGAIYNPFFLVYVALYSASIFAFVLSLLAIDVGALPALFARRFARRTIAWLVIGVGALLALLWLGRILPSLSSGAAPAGLESYSTLFVQAGDLGLVVPVAVLTGALLLRRHPVGYLFSSVLLVKGTTLGLGLLAMMVAMAVAGVAIVPAEAAFFMAVAMCCGVGTVHLFKCLPGRGALRSQVRGRARSNGNGPSHE